MRPPPLTEAQKAIILGDTDPSPILLCVVCGERVYEPYSMHFDRVHPEQWNTIVEASPATMLTVEALRRQFEIVLFETAREVYSVALVHIQDAARIIQQHMTEEV